jgi:hypothetical protein
MRHKLLLTLLCILVVSTIHLGATEKYAIPAKFITKRDQREVDCKIILDDKAKIMTAQSEFLKYRVKYSDVIAAEVEAKESSELLKITYKQPKANATLSFLLAKGEKAEFMSQFEQRVGVYVKRVGTTP